MSKIFLDDAVDIAVEVLECGGEVFRAEELIKRACSANNKDCNVFALPSIIITESDGQTRVKRIKHKGENLSRLCELNAAARALSLEYSKAFSSTPFTKIAEIISVFGATASFCIFFGGNLLDALFSGLISLIINYSPHNHLEIPIFSSNLISSFIAGVFAVLPSVFGIDTNYDKIIIGTIMLLVPGLTVANAARDMMNSDMLAGLLELADAIMSALSIAFGVAGALLIFGKL